MDLIVGSWEPITGHAARDVQEKDGEVMGSQVNNMSIKSRTWWLMLWQDSWFNTSPTLRKMIVRLGRGCLLHEDGSVYLRLGVCYSMGNPLLFQKTWWFVDREVRKKIVLYILDSVDERLDVS